MRVVEEWRGLQEEGGLSSMRVAGGHDTSTTVVNVAAVAVV